MNHATNNVMNQATNQTRNQEANQARLQSICVEHLEVAFGGRRVLENVGFDAGAAGLSVIVGRSGSGKTTLLRALNRLNETLPGCRTRGRVRLDLGRGLEDVYPQSLGARVRPLSELRRLVGMVFQTPSVLPVSVAQNIAVPLKVVRGVPGSEIGDRVRQALEAVGLWQETADRLRLPAASLSGGQQQRLCLARALALEPAVLLLDEPTASLDVHSARAIEDLLKGLAERYPLVVVSHNPRQAAELAQSLAVMAKGRMQARFERDIPDAGEIGRLLGEA